MKKQKCKSCNVKQAKRQCPGLKALICPSCCGMKRLKKIRCPDNCQYLENISFQETKFYEANKKKWFSEHYQQVFDNMGLFTSLMGIEKFFITFQTQGEYLDRHMAYKGLQFLRRTLSPISHIEGELSAFEEYLQNTIKYLKDDPEQGKEILPALDYLIKRFEEKIVTDKEFSEYMLFIKGFFKTAGMDVTEDAQEEEEDKETETPGGIIIP